MGVSAYVCGEAVGSSSSPLVIPITADVPRSDPALGLTVILIFNYIFGDFDFVAAVDDAEPEDDYSFCLFDDGLNHYSTSGTQPIPGVIANDLKAGTNNITLSTSGGAGPSWMHAFAVAVTGVNFPISGFAPLFTDDTLPNFILSLLRQCQTPPSGTPSAVSDGPVVIIDGGTDVMTFTSPLGAADTTWGWVTGDLAIYVLDGPQDADHGGWTWADGTLVDTYQYDFLGAGGQRQGAVAIATPALLAPGPSLDGAWADATTGAVIHGYAFISGDGPGPCTALPTGIPLFDTVFPV